MFRLQYCEYNRYNVDCDRIYRPGGSNDHLLLLLRYPMKIYQEGKILITGENACILYTQGECQHYQAVKRFRNSYLHFECGMSVLEHFGLPLNKVFYPVNYGEIDQFIKLLQEEYLSRQPYGTEQINALMTQLFVRAARAWNNPQITDTSVPDLYQTFQDIRLKMLSASEEEWPAKRLCRMVNMERTQFYFYYRKFFENTPKADLLQVRLDKAKNLLTNRALQIKQVAGLCGFSSQQHFTRYFKESCGCSPREYQKREWGENSDNIN